VNKKMMAALQLKRQSNQKKRDEQLAGFAKEAKELYHRGETSAKELGNLLLKVKRYNPFGGLRAWIIKNIGVDRSVRNRCNYAISLVNSDSKRNKKKRAGTANAKELKNIREALSSLLKSVMVGNQDEALKHRNVIVSAVDALVKKASYVAYKLGRKELADDLRYASDPRKREIGEKIMATEFNEHTLAAEFGSSLEIKTKKYDIGAEKAVAASASE
jgi:hypothetical protein